MVTVILVQHNRSDLTRGAVHSLGQHGAASHQVVVVDNGSTEPEALQWTGEFPWLEVIRLDANRGFGAGNNAGARVARGELLLFLNNDTIVSSDVLSPVERYFGENPECGAAGLALLNPDGSPQYSLGRWPTMLNEWKMKHRMPLYGESEYRSVDWVTAAAFVVRRQVFTEVGGFDERYFMYFEDADICRRIRDLGKEIHFLPSISLVHLGGGSQPGGMPPRVRLEYRRSQMRFYSRHASPAQRTLLRLFLIGKSALLALKGGGTTRQIARELFWIAVSSPRDVPDGMAPGP